MSEENVVGLAGQVRRVSTSVAIAGSLLILLLTLAAVEAMSLLVIRFNMLPPGLLVYESAAEQAALSQIDVYLRQRDPLLGWPRANWTRTSAHDATGARPSPAFPSPHGACVSLYGDSFTYGAQVSHVEAWGNRLAQLLRCRVANYGVNAYGLDQALLRFRRNVNDEAKLVILGIFHEGIRRNVNQYRRFLTGGDIFAFKPRFILQEGELELVGLPVHDAETMRLSIDAPERVLRHEWFLPGTKNGPLPSSTFPYSRTVLHMVLSSEFRSWLGGWPNWFEFYDEKHPSGALPLTQQLVAAFAELAAERGKHAVALVFPDPAAYALFDRNGVNIASPLIQPLINGGVHVIDLLPALHEQLVGRDYCEITLEPKCQGHYNAEGQAIVADIVFAEISRTLTAAKTNGPTQ